MKFDQGKFTAKGQGTKGQRSDQKIQVFDPSTPCPFALKSFLKCDRPKYIW